MNELMDKVKYFFNVLCECFHNDEPKSPPPYNREIIDTFKFNEDEDEDVRYRRFYKNYDHKEYDYF